jgi:Flp pilus assembly protein TadG
MKLLLMKNSKGQVLLMVAVAMIVILGIAALAIDLGMAYGVRTKLYAATDAAAIAAARGVSVSQDTAKAEAQDFFNANFPAGLLGAKVESFSINPVQATDGSWSVTVTATASVPTYFAKLLGDQKTLIGATASTTIASVDMMLVMDCSGSLGTPPGTPSDLKSAADNFVKIVGSNPSNRIGLIHFAGGVILDVPLAVDSYVDTRKLTRFIDNLPIEGATTTEEAMRVAWQQLHNIPAGKKSKIQAIVLFTDGAANGMVANFNNGGAPRPVALYSEFDAGLQFCENHNPNDQNPLLPSGDSGNWRAVRGFLADQQSTTATYCDIDNTLPNTDYQNTSLLHYLGPSFRKMTYAGSSIINTRCNVNRAARNLLENYAHMARTDSLKPIRIFTIGLGESLTNLEVKFNCGYGNEESGVNILKRLANVSDADTYDTSQTTGAFAFAQSSNDLNAAFGQIASAILRLTQ